MWACTTYSTANYNRTATDYYQVDVQQAKKPLLIDMHKRPRISSAMTF